MSENAKHSDALIAAYNNFFGVRYPPAQEKLDRLSSAIATYNQITRATTPTASELEYYSDDPEKLKRLLAQRDKFIVDQGLWSSFVANIGEE